MVLSVNPKHNNIFVSFKTESKERKEIRKEITKRQTLLA